MKVKRLKRAKQYSSSKTRNFTDVCMVGGFQTWQFYMPSNLRRHANLSKLKAALACTIFDTTISTILTNNSEIWGVYTKPDFKTWDGSQIEKLNLQFCKRYLEVNNKASNIACRAELGRFPLNITINQKILKYILYIQS